MTQPKDLLDPAMLKKMRENAAKEPDPCGSVPSWLGRIKAPHSSGKFQAGTGTLIADTVVVTAAHVVFDADAGKVLDKKVVFEAGYGGTDGKTVEVSQVYLPEEYVTRALANRASDLFDFAFLKLATRVDSTQGYPAIRFNAVVDTSADKTEVTLYGYPGGTKAHTQTASLRGVDQDALDTARTERACLDLPVKTGFDSGGSGGPVLLASGPTLIGVIAACIPATAPVLGNTVAVFTPQVEKHYKAALEQFNR